MLIALGVVAVAWAAPPKGVVPAIAPADAPQQYAEYLKSKGGAATDTLACDVLWKDEALVCFKVDEKGVRRWVTTADVAAWKTDVGTLRATATEHARVVLQTQPTKQKIVDMTASYWKAAEGDGWSAAGVLAPDALAVRIGGAPVLVGVPSDGVLIAWTPGDAQVDKIMAVGVKEMYDAQDGAVTPVIHEWTGKEWAPYGEAVATTPGGIK